MGEVAAFEELVGSHGGMGGGQSFPFILFPSELEWPEEPVVGAERVHTIMRRWLAGLGQRAYTEPRGASSTESPGSRTAASTPGASAAS